MQEEKSDSRQDLGRRGEELAVDYLKKKGYGIICRNFRFGRGELDIVARKGGDIIVCEVKSLRHGTLGCAEQRISRAQKGMIIRTAYAFLDLNPQYTGWGVRFDFLIVDFALFPAKITHYREAFWQR